MMKSFKQRLMAFVCLICFLLIGLLLLLAHFLLEPAYLAMMKSNLNKEIDAIAQAVERYGLLNEQKDDFTEAFKAEVDPLIIEGQCLDIADSGSWLYLGGSEHIVGCSLHTERVGNAWSGWVDKRSENNMLLLKLRQATVEDGTINTVVRGRDGLRQYVVGRLVSDQGAVLLLSANLERIYQASDIIQRQLGSLSVVMLSVALLLAWLFASWFTQPITALSAAARRMAHGDYAVQLPVTQRDEIGVLTQDFNTMAREVSRADALQKDIIANVSHDLRTPLTIIKGYAETIRDLNGEDREKRDAQLDIIISEADRLSALVGSVMELSRLDAGTEKFNPVTFDISDFCEELSYRYTDICEKSGYRLQVETPGERLITADPDLLSRVLHNLLANAIAHIGADGVVALRVRDVGNAVRVEVEDHGTGIAPDELSHVFERYYRARQANGRPGTGLGLSIVRAILVTHKFHFGVDSTEGKGSMFWFDAPLAPHAATPTPPAGTKKPPAGKAANAKNGKPPADKATNAKSGKAPADKATGAKNGKAPADKATNAKNGKAPADKATCAKGGKSSADEIADAKDGQAPAECPPTAPGAPADEAAPTK